MDSGLNCLEAQKRKVHIPMKEELDNIAVLARNCQETVRKLHLPIYEKNCYTDVETKVEIKPEINGIANITSDTTSRSAEETSIIVESAATITETDIKEENIVEITLNDVNVITNNTLESGNGNYQITENTNVPKSNNNEAISRRVDEDNSNNCTPLEFVKIEPGINITLDGTNDISDACNNTKENNLNISNTKIEEDLTLVTNISNTSIEIKEEHTIDNNLSQETAEIEVSSTQKQVNTEKKRDPTKNCNKLDKKLTQNYFQGKFESKKKYVDIRSYFKPTQKRIRRSSDHGSDEIQPKKPKNDCDLGKFENSESSSLNCNIKSKDTSYDLNTSLDIKNSDTELSLTNESVDFTEEIENISNMPVYTKLDDSTDSPYKIGPVQNIINQNLVNSTVNITNNNLILVVPPAVPYNNFVTPMLCYNNYVQVVPVVQQQSFVTSHAAILESELEPQLKAVALANSYLTQEDDISMAQSTKECELTIKTVESTGLKEVDSDLNALDEGDEECCSVTSSDDMSASSSENSESLDQKSTVQKEEEDVEEMSLTNVEYESKNGDAVEDTNIKEFPDFRAMKKSNVIIQEGEEVKIREDIYIRIKNGYQMKKFIRPKTIGPNPSHLKIVKGVDVQNLNLYEEEETKKTRPAIPQLSSEQIENMVAMKCDKCEFKTMKGKKDLALHSVIHEPNKKLYRCSLCSYKGFSHGYFKRHMAAHSENKSNLALFKCEQCSYQTNDSSNLKKHKRKHFTDEEKSALPDLTCEKCCFITKFQDHMTKHINQHHKNLGEVKIYKCDKCPYYTRAGPSLKSHVLSYHTEAISRKIFKCEEPDCEYTSLAIKSLRNHEHRKHNKGIPRDRPSIETMFCFNCPYKTKFKTLLKRHMRDRHIMKKYSCKYCDFKVSTVTRFKSHLLRHKDPSECELFQCSACDYSTRIKHDLSCHVARAHEGKRKRTSKNKLTHDQD